MQGSDGDHPRRDVFYHHDLGPRGKQFSFQAERVIRLAPASDRDHHFTYGATRTDPGGHETYFALHLMVSHVSIYQPPARNCEPDEDLPDSSQVNSGGERRVREVVPPSEEQKSRSAQQDLAPERDPRPVPQDGFSRLGRELAYLLFESVHCDLLQVVGQGQRRSLQTVDGRVDWFPLPSCRTTKVCLTRPLVERAGQG